MTIGMVLVGAIWVIVATGCACGWRGRVSGGAGVYILWEVTGEQGLASGDVSKDNLTPSVRAFQFGSRACRKPYEACTTPSDTSL